MRPTVVWSSSPIEKSARKLSRFDRKIKNIQGVLKGGLIGKHPSLTDLEGDAQKFHTDFRQVYATMLDHWLGWSSTAVLGKHFESLKLLRV